MIETVSAPPSTPAPAPLTVGRHFGQSIRFVRRHFASFFQLTAVLLLPQLAISYLMAGASMLNVAGMLRSVPPLGLSVRPMNALSAAMTVTQAPWFSAIAGPITWVYTLFVTLAVYSLALDLRDGKTEATDTHAVFAARRLWAYSWRWILAYLAVATLGALLVVLPAMGLTALLQGSATAMFEEIEDPRVNAAVATLAAVTAAISFYLIGRWTVGDIGVLDQNWGAIESLRASWRLTQGRAWRTVLIVLLLLLTNVFVVGVPAAAVGALMSDIKPAAALDGSVALVQYLLTVLWLPFWCVGIVLLYDDLRARRERQAPETAITDMPV